MKVAANLSGHTLRPANFRTNRIKFHPAGKPEASIYGVSRRLRSHAYSGASECLVNGCLKRVKYPGLTERVPREERRRWSSRRLSNGLKSTALKIVSVRRVDQTAACALAAHSFLPISMISCSSSSAVTIPALISRILAYSSG